MTDSTLEKTRKGIARYTEWLEHEVVPSLPKDAARELEGWRNEMAAIRALVDQQQHVRIALVGTTGAGKSTLLNAVLGQEVLPVGVMQPTTAFVTSVQYGTGESYRVLIRFCTESEWRKDLDLFAAILSPGEDDLEEERSESARVVDAARKRITAVYGIKPDDTVTREQIMGWDTPAEIERIFSQGSIESMEFEDARTMLDYLRKMVRGESQLWPLIKQVHIAGPYECLRGGIELVDLPGLNDPNEARVEVTRDYLRTSPFVWVVFNMVRGLTQDINRILYEGRLLRTLVLSGAYGSLSLVGTKADDIDMHVAIELGLAEDCSVEELIHAYRERTVPVVREQLSQMIRDMTSGDGQSEAVEHLLRLAAQAPVHAVSANAYIKIKRIAPLRKDYGIEREEDTGIPGLHAHMARIAEESGTAFNVQLARKRLKQLGVEIAFFLSGSTSDVPPEVVEVRRLIDRELIGFKHLMQSAFDHAKQRVELYRERFVAGVVPMLHQSAEGVRKVTDDWRRMHWAQLRAAVHRGGVFKSPTTGHLYDLNEDLTEPLLARLPVSWEQFFTHDIDRAVDEYVIKTKDTGRNYSERVRLIVELRFNLLDDGVEKQLKWFEEKVASLAQASKTQLLNRVIRIRGELTAKIPAVACRHMEPVYATVMQISGKGMKKRMLDVLIPAALGAARPIYETIQTDLLEGLDELVKEVRGLMASLARTAHDQAGTVAHNAQVDIGDAPVSPKMASLLETLQTLETSLEDEQPSLSLGYPRIPPDVVPS